jgi:hypothetical protein
LFAGLAKELVPISWNCAERLSFASRKASICCWNERSRSSCRTQGRQLIDGRAIVILFPGHRIKLEPDFP